MTGLSVSLLHAVPWNIETADGYLHACKREVNLNFVTISKQKQGIVTFSALK